MTDFIEFPALGWKFFISPYLIEDWHIFGLTINIKWYGLLIAAGFLLAIIYALKRARSFDINPDRMIDVVLVSTLVAFIGARLYYVLFSDERAAYLADPVSILYVWNGGLAIYGGILFAFIAGIFMTRWRKVNTLAMFDLASLGFLIGQAVGRWGNFFNQEAFGGNTTLPWGMTGNIIQSGANGSEYDIFQPVHPTFLYESLWCLAGFILLHIVSKKAYTFKGKIFSLYLIWYGAGRFAIESLRTDSLFMGTMRVSQVVAILAILAGIIMLLVLRSRRNELPADLFEGESSSETEASALQADMAGDAAELLLTEDAALNRDLDFPEEDENTAYTGEPADTGEMDADTDDGDAPQDEE